MPSEYPFIASRQHPLVQQCRELVTRRSEGRALLDGQHLLADALTARIPLEFVLADASHVDASASLHRLLGEARSRGIEVVTASASVLDAASPVRSPSPVVAIARMRPAPIESALAAPAVVVVASGVQDPGNLGAMVRVADALGATSLVATRGSAWPFGWKALRAAMGSAFRLPVTIVEEDLDLVAALRAARIASVAATSDGDHTPDAADLTIPLAFWLGGEGQGLAPATVAAADLRVRIPMRAGVDSLNVATAAAVLLYETRRQRQGAPK